MARSRPVLAAAVMLAALAPSAHAGAVRALPTDDRVVTTLQTTDRCRDGRTRPRGAVDVRWRARVDASLLAQARGTRRSGDWDLLVLDRSGRSLDAARGSGAREAVQAIVPRGNTVTVRACRHRGAAPSLPLRLSAVTLPATPAPNGTASLVEVQTPTRADVARLQRLGLDLGEDGHGHDITVITHSAADLDVLRRTGLDFEVLVPDLAAQDRRDRAADAMPRPSLVPSGRTTYRTYEEIQAELKDLAGRHPAIARTFALPDPTSQGREISGIEIADDPARAARDGRPTFVLMGVHHAREWPAAEIGMEFVNDVLQSAGGGDAEIRRLLEQVRVLVIPVQNPDGYVWSRGNTALDVDTTNGSLIFGAATDIQAYRRRTCSGPLPPAAPCDLQPGADSNRNYGPNWGGGGASTVPTDPTYRGDAPFSEPETEGIHKLLQRNNVTLVMSLHTVLGAVLRPPGVQGDGAMPDDAGLTAFGEPMAEATGYLNTTFWEGLGYDGSGITEDWAYGSLGAYTYTIEIAGDGFHGPYAENVEAQWLGPDESGGMRRALRHAALGAADPALHSVLEVRTRPGATLKLDKAFKEQTAPPCTFVGGLIVSQCVGTGDPIELDDSVAFEMTAPANGKAVWHVPPSTRPQERAAGKTEQFTLTCSKDGAVLETRSIVVDRGGKLSVDCAAPPFPAAAPPGPPAAPPRKAAAKKKAKPCSRGSKRARAKCRRKLAAKRRAAARRRAARQ